MIESMAASSLVKLSTSGKQAIPLSLSRQPLANSAPLGRVTHNREKAYSVTKAPSPSTGNDKIVYVDLGIEDAMPPPAKKDPVAVQPPATNPPAKETTTRSMGVHSTSLAEQGKTKLQFCIDRKVAHLEE
jgi:hypothetical protein